MSKGDAGKGDTYRPVDKKKYDENYDRIFGVKKNGNDRCSDDSKKQIPEKNDVLGEHNAGNS